MTPASGRKDASSSGVFARCEPVPFTPLLQTPFAVCVRADAPWRAGLDNGGSTLRDYRNAYGAAGSNQQHFNAYDRAGQPCGREATMVKYLASEAAWEAAEAAMTTFGGYGVACEFDIERKWKESRLFRTAPISNNLVLAQVAEHLLGMPRSY